MRVRELLDGLACRFSAAGIDSARTDARLLAAFAMKVAPVALRMHPDLEVPADVSEKIEEYAARRIRREPVSKILEARGFWSLDFRVTKDVLDPRPDSETLIETATEIFPDRTKPLEVLDLGTGSGCLALSVLAEYPNATAVGTDVSERALAVARENAACNGLSGRFTAVCADWTHQGWTQALNGRRFDLILSNPPYIAENERETLEPEVVNFDPCEALFGGEDGLDPYRVLAPVLGGMMKADGAAIFEFGKGQHEAVRRIFEQNGLVFGRFGTDLGGVVRCITAFREKNALKA